MEMIPGPVCTENFIRIDRPRESPHADGDDRTDPPGHVLGDCRLGDRKSELDQFAVNAWGTPKWILLAHAAN